MTLPQQTQTQFKKTTEKNSGQRSQQTKKKHTGWRIEENQHHLYRSTLPANLINRLRKHIIKRNSNNGKFKCFNNKKLSINYTIQLDLTSGNSSTPQNHILVVTRNTKNPMGGDILQKQGDTNKLEKSNKIDNTKNRIIR